MEPVDLVEAKIILVAVVVLEEPEDKLQEVLATVTEKVKETATEAVEKVKEAAATAKKNTEEALAKAEEEVKDSFEPGLQADKINATDSKTIGSSTVSEEFFNDEA